MGIKNSQILSEYCLNIIQIVSNFLSKLCLHGVQKNKKKHSISINTERLRSPRLRTERFGDIRQIRIPVLVSSSHMVIQ